MLSVEAPAGVPEVTEGADLTDLLLAVATPVDGDIVTITSKVVSKAEGRAVAGDRSAWIDRETARTVAIRGETRIVRTRLGLTLAAAGVDGSNVTAGTSLLLPVDPDGTARTVRSALAVRAGANVGVIVTDTAGRPWRAGQTDIAIGAAGVQVVEDFAGRVDGHGNELLVTTPAVADELASAAELASGKLGGRPFALLRGRADLVLPPGEHGPGAGDLIRPDGQDLFGYGAREAVLRATRRRPQDAPPFGEPVGAEEMATVLRRLGEEARMAEDGSILVATQDVPGLTAIAFAHGWTASCTTGDTDLRLLPRTP